MRKIELLLLIVIFTTSGCATTGNGTVNLKIKIETFDQQSRPMQADCTLFSATTKMDVEAPNDVRYTASCGPINIFCTNGNLKGEFGLIPEPVNTVGEKLLITSGIGYAFDRMVDTITPFGAILNYSSSFYSDGDEACVIPRKIKIILE